MNHASCPHATSSPLRYCDPCPVSPCPIEEAARRELAEQRSNDARPSIFVALNGQQMHIMDAFDTIVDEADIVTARRLQKLREPIRKFIDRKAAPIETQAAAAQVTDVVTRVAWLLAEQNGADHPNQLIYQGHPPEPWGEVWNEYEDQAKQIVDLVAPLLAQPAAREVEPPVAWYQDGVQFRTGIPYRSYTHDLNSVTSTHVPLYAAAPTAQPAECNRDCDCVGPCKIGYDGPQPAAPTPPPLSGGAVQAASTPTAAPGTERT